MISLFGSSKEKCFVITKLLYEAKKKQNEVYYLRQALSPKGNIPLFVLFETPEVFLTEVPLDTNDKKYARKLMQELTISEAQADELALAKKMKCPLAISDKQLWLVNAAKKAGIKAVVLR